MARYTCCGHRFETAESYREHRRTIHGEENASLPEPMNLWQRLLAILRGGRSA